MCISICSTFLNDFFENLLARSLFVVVLLTTTEMEIIDNLSWKIALLLFAVFIFGRRIGNVFLEVVFEL